MTMQRLLSLLTSVALYVSWHSPLLAQTTPHSTLPTWNAVLTLTGGNVFNVQAGANNYIPPQQGIFSFYNYAPTASSQNQSIIGGFLAAEFIKYPSWLMQMGISYYQPSAFHTSGVVTQGADIASENNYQYHYTLNTQQLLAEAKLLYLVKQRFYPYLSGGIGASQNKAHDFSVIINPPFTTFSNQFTNQTTTAFSYMAGAGIDVSIFKNLRIGLGYRFTDFGRVSTGPAKIDDVVTTNKLSQSHLYTNILEAQLTFVFM